MQCRAAVSESAGYRWINALMMAGILLVGILCGSSLTAAEFDHDATRFPLQGFHRYVECEICHVSGRFKGTPADCFACHGGSSVIPGGAKSLNHMPTSNQCSDCHRPDAWDVVTRFDHSQTQGVCIQCHNGTTQPGKPPQHVVSSDQCESCHTTLGWNLARFDHSNITAACSSCHNNFTATGKPSNHLMTTAECDVCHSTRAWSPAGFDHQGITQPCSSCHNGTTATGKDSGHFVTNRECDSCHVTSRWSSVRYVHQGGSYPGDHGGRLDCNDCHQGNMETLVWRFPAYQPDCAGCHANRYEMGEHVKVNSPRINYTVSELRDCSGACHVYTDSTFSTIQRFRTGQHRVTDGEFGD